MTIFNILVVDQDACQWESYKAECGADEVVVIEAALYGRMSYGRCVKRDYGYVGCFADVTPQADARYAKLDVPGTYKVQVELYNVASDLGMFTFSSRN